MVTETKSVSTRPCEYVSPYERVLRTLPTPTAAVMTYASVFAIGHPARKTIETGISYLKMTRIKTAFV